MQKVISVKEGCQNIISDIRYQWIAAHNSDPDKVPNQVTDHPFWALISDLDRKQYMSYSGHAALIISEVLKRHSEIHELINVTTV